MKLAPAELETLVPKSDEKVEDPADGNKASPEPKRRRQVLVGLTEAPEDVSIGIFRPMDFRRSVAASMAKSLQSAVDLQSREAELVGLAFDLRMAAGEGLKLYASMHDWTFDLWHPSLPEGDHPDWVERALQAIEVFDNPHRKLKRDKDTGEQ